MPNCQVLKISSLALFLTFGYEVSKCFFSLLGMRTLFSSFFFADYTDWHLRVIRFSCNESQFDLVIFIFPLVSLIIFRLWSTKFYCIIIHYVFLYFYFSSLPIQRSENQESYLNVLLAATRTPFSTENSYKKKKTKKKHGVYPKQIPIQSWEGERRLSDLKENS